MEKNSTKRLVVGLNVSLVIYRITLQWEPTVHPNYSVYVNLFLGLFVFLFVCFILSSDFTNIADCCKKKKADIENYCKSNFSM